MIYENVLIRGGERLKKMNPLLIMAMTTAEENGTSVPIVYAYKDTKPSDGVTDEYLEKNTIGVVSRIKFDNNKNEFRGNIVMFDALSLAAKVDPTVIDDLCVQIPKDYPDSGKPLLRSFIMQDSAMKAANHTSEQDVQPITVSTEDGVKLEKVTKELEDVLKEVNSKEASADQNKEVVKKIKSTVENALSDVTWDFKEGDNDHAKTE